MNSFYCTQNYQPAHTDNSGRQVQLFFVSFRLSRFIMRKNSNSEWVFEYYPVDTGYHWDRDFYDSGYRLVAVSPTARTLMIVRGRDVIFKYVEAK